VKKGTRKPYFRDDLFLKKIGENIRAERLKQGLTQSELAFRCDDIDYSQINRVELGKVNFSISFLNLVAHALQIHPRDMIPE
jgi:transcriptional regulator with XRE-family HTH domain